ncbi:MAG: hypothetical protein JNK79_08205 [Chitinophagaceae bacterium]|nr:hypothetical protein [Chitinophagaceae bacterium]
MIKSTIAVFCFSIFYCCAFAQRLPQYDINVTLNDKDRSLDGFLCVHYTNNSSDSIRFLWFNIYPNAFKSDRTAFSEYLLTKGRTDFYFSEAGRRGYINRLDFRAGDDILTIEDHPQYIDVIKVLLAKPLAPGDTLTITTPFHVKVPSDFDGIGYKYPQYSLKYWYPAVAGYVKPLTSADSSSNEKGDYNVVVVVPLKFKINTPVAPVSEAPVNDSTKKISYVATAMEDFYFTIEKPHVIAVAKKKETSLFDSSFNKKIKSLFSKPVLPAIGYNEYDGFQLGILSHNYYKKEQLLNYYIAPAYTFKSKSIAGIAGASYRFTPEKFADEVEIGFTASAFSYENGVDTTGENVYAKLFKIVPFIKAKLPSSKPNVEKKLSFRTYVINEKELEFVRYSVDSFFYPAAGEYATRFVNELTFDYSSKRILYPYHAQLQVQQGMTWYRVNATGNYFFNYPKGGGASVRVFAAKFGYIGSLGSSEKFATSRYQPKLTAVRGSEDFTYSNYFIGRNQFDGFSSQQVMMRDGGLKLRTDLFDGLQGRSDNWIAAVNVNTTLPDIFPVRLPVKLFLDAGTYDEAWDPENANPRFLYVAGLQLSLFKDVLNVYAPLFYSKEFRDRLKSVPEENKFSKRLSFSIDIQRINIRNIFD